MNMMSSLKHVALNVPGSSEFISNGTPSYCITNFSFQADGVPYDRTLYLENDFVRHIYNNISLDKLDIVMSNYYNRINIIYEMAETIVRRKTKSKDFNYINPFSRMRKSNITPVVMYNTKHYYEYDVHSAFASLIMYKFFVSDKNEGHVSLTNCMNPLKEVHFVKYVGDNIMLCSEEDPDRLYLCSTLMNNHKDYSKLLGMCRIIISDCWNTDKIDCSHLVYSIVVSQVFKSLYSKQKESITKLYHSLLQISSIKYFMDNRNDTNIFGCYSDAVFVHKPDYKQVSITEKVIGCRYYKYSLSKVNNRSSLNWPSHSVVTDIHKATSYGFGWASFDVSHIKNRDTENTVMYHVDIKDAYPSRLFNYVGETIDKRMFGTVKCTNSRLYQRIRLEVSEISRKIFNIVGIENVIYWKTDGGIILLDKSIDLYALLSGTGLLHIDKVISSKVVKLPDWVKLPENITGHALTSRVWAYNVKTDTSSNLHWANGYEEKMPEIFRYNGMKIPDDYTTLDIYEEFITNG